MRDGPNRRVGHWLGHGGNQATPSLAIVPTRRVITAWAAVTLTPAFRPPACVETAALNACQQNQWLQALAWRQAADSGRPAPHAPNRASQT